MNDRTLVQRAIVTVCLCSWNVHYFNRFCFYHQFYHKCFPIKTVQIYEFKLCSELYIKNMNRSSNQPFIELTWKKCEINSGCKFKVLPILIKMVHHMPHCQQIERETFTITCSKCNRTYINYFPLCLNYSVAYTCQI